MEVAAEEAVPEVAVVALVVVEPVEDGNKNLYNTSNYMCSRGFFNINHKQYGL